MKKYLVFLVFFMSTSIASAQYFYVKGSMGPAWQSSNSFVSTRINYKTSFLGAFSLSGGFQYNPMFSTEVELAVRSAEIDAIDGAPWLGDLDSTVLMFNGNYRVQVFGNLFATFGAGFGLISAELYDAVSDEFADGSSLAVQFMIGLETEISENFSMTFEYRRLSAVDLELSGTGGVFREDLSYTHGSILIGGKLSF